MSNISCLTPSHSAHTGPGAAASGDAEERAGGDASQSGPGGGQDHRQQDQSGP